MPCEKYMHLIDELCSHMFLFLPGRVKKDLSPSLRQAYICTFIYMNLFYFHKKTHEQAVFFRNKNVNQSFYECFTKFRFRSLIPRPACFPLFHRIALTM